MSEWNDLAHWMYGDVKMDRGFWYSHPLHEINGLTEEQLFWVPDERNLCMLWRVACFCSQKHGLSLIPCSNAVCEQAVSPTGAYNQERQSTCFCEQKHGTRQMRKEGHFRRSYWFRERWTDDVLYAMLEEKWNTLKALIR